MNGFEGYVGIQVGERQMFDDIVLALLFALFVAFAIVFHVNRNLFMKMVRDTFHIKDRLSLFEDAGGNETLFLSFTTFQSFFLFSIAIFITGQLYGFIPYHNTVELNLRTVAYIFIIIFAFYLFKQFLYHTIGFIFTGSDPFKKWRTGYAASTGLWGVSLYVPVVSLAFTKIHPQTPIIMIVILYFLWRLVITYKTVCIFNVRGVGALYIILYLCAQEILPLVFLYKGVIYLYNHY
jgi:hypothetical protein